LLRQSGGAGHNAGHVWSPFRAPADEGRRWPGFRFIGNSSVDIVLGNMFLTVQKGIDEADEMAFSPAILCSIEGQPCSTVPSTTLTRRNGIQIAASLATKDSGPQGLVLFCSSPIDESRSSDPGRLAG